MVHPTPESDADKALAGRYRIVATIGAGGMGTVYRAVDLESGKSVAVKVLDQTRASHASLEQRFAREVAAIQRLTSRHVVRLLDAGSLGGGGHFMVMEYLEGRDLHRILKRSGPLAIGRAVRLIRQACLGVGEAHALGIVHRDLKPANLFVTAAPDGAGEMLKVLDFGISKLPQATLDELALTGTGTVLGSPVYMSPEQMSSSRSVDARTDVWALGMVLYQILSGTLPYDAEGLPELCARVLTHEPRPLSEKVAVPPALEAIVMRCLKRDPAERFGRVDELAAALAPFEDAPDAPTVLDTSPWTPAPRTFVPLATPTPLPALPALAPLEGDRSASRWIWLLGGIVGVVAGLVFLTLSALAERREGGDRAEPPRPRPVVRQPIAPEAPPSAPNPAASPWPATASPPPSKAKAAERRSRKTQGARRDIVVPARGEFDSPLPP